jgi:hypothetical protein
MASDDEYTSDLSEIEQCSDIDEFAQKFFSIPPGPPKSQQLDLSTSQGRVSDTDVCQLLGDILIRGVEILFPNLNVLDLGQIQLDKIQPYFNSLGFSIILNPATREQIPPNACSQVMCFPPHKVVFAPLNA